MTYHFTSGYFVLIALLLGSQGCGYILEETQKTSTSESSPSTVWVTPSTDAFSNQTQYHFSWTNDSVSKVELYSSADCAGAMLAAQSLSTSSYTPSALAHGITYSVKAIAGTHGQFVSCSPAITIDTGLPLLSVAAPLAKSVGVAAYSFPMTSSDDLSGVKEYDYSMYASSNCSGAVFSSATETTLSAISVQLQTGINSVKVTARDRAGNLSAAVCSLPISLSSLEKVTSLTNELPTKEFLTIGGVTFFANKTAALGMELWKSDGTSSGTVLVKDINPGASSSSPARFAERAGILYFFADDGVHEEELWRSDGTAAGTTLVKDIFTGTNGWGHGEIINMGGTLYLAAETVAEGVELWKSDGTTAGTVLLKNITSASLPSNPADFEVVGGTLYFNANDWLSTGSELWKTDGTAAGTVLVKDIAAGFGNSMPGKLTELGALVIFQAGGNGTGFGIWKSDGTGGGTTLLKDNTAALSEQGAQGFVKSGSYVFYTVDDGVNGIELWRTDGTVGGTVMVKDIATGAAPSFPRSLIDVAGTLYFSADDGVNGRELWKSDGTGAGTVLVKDIFAGAHGSFPFSLINTAGTIYFSANDGTNGAELWKSDGTTVGTVLVKDILPGVNGSEPTSLSLGAGGRVMFMAVGSESQLSVWASDGTAGGTTEMGPSADSPKGVMSYAPFAFNNAIFSIIQTEKYGFRILKSTGAANNISTLIDTGRSFSGIGAPTEMNGLLYFSLNDGTNGNELWKSDGTPTGTMIVKDTMPGAVPNDLNFLTPVNGNLFYMQSSTSSSIWKSDGTVVGTTQMASYPGNSHYPDWLTGSNNLLFYAMTTVASGNELWKSNGTAAGTVLVKELVAAAGSGEPFNLIDLNGVLMFAATDGINGKELWRSDGSAAGTVLVKDIKPGAGDSMVRPSFSTDGRPNLLNHGGVIYFVADDGTAGTELWKSNGTAAGTVLVKDIYVGSGASWPSSFSVLGGEIYFLASDDATGRPDLWKTDGTAVGTTKVFDLYPGEVYSTGRLYKVGQHLFFNVGYGSTYDLWISDGTTLGTQSTAILFPLMSGANADRLAFLNNTYFAYMPGTFSLSELWAFKP